jgi:alpha-ribazole phosphatase
MQLLIYLIRHGEIDKLSPRRFLGQTDLPLNDNGIRQVKSLHEQLRNISFSHVFSSPLQRAVQTATLVSGVSPESVHRIEDLKEINLGAWEGLSVDEVRTRFPGAYEQRGQDLEFFRPEKGESFADLADRCYPALLSLAEQYTGPLLVVAHAGVNRVLLSLLQQKPLQKLFDIPQDYCGVNILRCNSKTIKIEATNLRNLW